MCREDVALGKARNPSKGFSGTGSQANVVALTPDANRVALVLSFAGNGAIFTAPGHHPADSAVFTLGDTEDAPTKIVMSNSGSPLVLRLEEVGSIVTGQVIVNVSSYYNESTVSVLPIISYVNIPPIER